MRIVSIILAIGMLFSMPVSSAKTVIKPFAGVWVRCDRYLGYDVCSYMLLAQKDARLCGLWGYWASGREYQGRLTGNVTRHVAKVDRICGRPGSETSTKCAGDDGAQETWQPSDKTIFICKGALYESRAGQSMSCRGIDQHLGLPKARGNVQSKIIFDPPDRAWLKACAEGTAAET